MLWNNVSRFIGGFYKPSEEEADDQEACDQHQRPNAQPARAAPSDKGRVGFVQGIPHLGAAGGASWDLRLCCGPAAAWQRNRRFPPPAPRFSATAG